jgi:hypothetical protein
MKFRDIHTKLAARLRSGKQPEGNGNDAHLPSYPNLDDMVSKTQPQEGSALMRVPLEIRNLILDNLWADAGTARHIIFQNGRYTSSRCVTDHSTPDELMEECARRRTGWFQDATLWQRMTSAWGNHWECEELCQARQSKATTGASWNPFLAMLLVCRQM